jgi:hypothetical protein
MCGPRCFVAVLAAAKGPLVRIANAPSGPLCVYGPLGHPNKRMTDDNQEETIRAGRACPESRRDQGRERGHAPTA